MLVSTIAKEGSVSIVYLSGELNAATEDDLTKLLMGLVNDGSHQIILELSELGYISSNGLRPLLEWTRATQNLSGHRKLTLCCMQEFVRTVFEATGFDRKFPVHDTLEEAIESF